jgi:hypothetical protein
MAWKEEEGKTGHENTPALLGYARIRFPEAWFIEFNKT